MSQQIVEIVGQKENRLFTAELTDSTIYVTSFFGGIKRGSCLQFSIASEDGSNYVQLTTKQVKELSESLKSWLKDHPEQNENENLH